MWLKFLLSRPVSITSFHWTPSMESGRSSPTLKTFEAASMSTSPAAEDEVKTKLTTPALGSSVLQKIPSRKSPVADLKPSAVVAVTATTAAAAAAGGKSKFRTPSKARSPPGPTMRKNVEPIKFRNLICTTGTERLTREFRDVKCSGMTQIRELKLCDNDLFHWRFLLLPDMAPYNKNAFQAEIKFPTSYPQMAPVITVHNIYHPNVDEKGFVCLHCLSHWSRTTKIEDVLQKLFALIRDPEPHHPMRFDVADEYLKDRKVFMHKAFEAAKAFGVPRPKF